VLALRDQDGDGLPETPRVLAEGMTLPNGIAYHADALYISGGSHIYRLMLDGERALEVLIDDLPAGYTGFWTGDLTVGPDERLYVATGAPCDFCEPEEAGRGAILSFALDGSDRQVVATGLRQPADLAFREGVLWTVDTARDALEDADLDELNRVEAGAHFGWPYCVGMDNRPDLPDVEFNCEEAVAPALTFPTHSTPLGLAAYSAGTLPAFEGTLLVVLGGTDNELAVEGYSLVMVPFDEAGDPVEMVEIVPGAGGLGRDLERSERHYRQLSFFPHRPLDVAVSPEGWIYVSVGDGQIVALRP
jgi:glucose/arabinose dehydrogenase